MRNGIAAEICASTPLSEHETLQQQSQESRPLGLLQTHGFVYCPPGTVVIEPLRPQGAGVASSFCSEIVKPVQLSPEGGASE